MRSLFYSLFKMKLSVNEILLLGFVGILILVPTLQYERWGIDHLYNNKRLIELGLFGLAAILIIVSSQLREQISIFYNLLSINTQLTILAIFFIGGASCMFAKMPDWALLEFAHYLMLAILIFFVGSIAFIGLNKAIMYLKFAVIGVVFFYLARVSFFYVLYQFGIEPLWPGSLNGKALYSFSYVRFFNQVQTWTIPIIVSLGWYYWQLSKKQWIRFGIAALIVGWGILVIASGGRGTILGVVTGALVVWAFLVKKKGRFFSYNVILAVLTLFGHYVFFDVLGESTKQTIQRSSSSGRFDNWINLIPELLEKPFIGYGPMHYASIKFDNPWGHPHNWFLQFGYEWGGMAACLMLILFLMGLYKFGQQLNFNLNDPNYSKQRYWLKFGLLWSLIAGFVHSFFSGLIVMPLSQLWLVLIVGVSMGFYFEEKPGIKNASNLSRRGHLLVIGVIAVSFLGFAYWGSQHSIDRSQVDAHFYKENKSSRSYPRYWQQGKIGLKGLNKSEKSSKSNL